jgi:hypothetical protein
MRNCEKKRNAVDMERPQMAIWLKQHGEATDDNMAQATWRSHR